MGTTMDILPAPPDGRTTTHMRARSFCSQERCFSAPDSSPGPAVPRTPECQHMLASASRRKAARLVQSAGRAAYASNCGLLPPTERLFSWGRSSGLLGWGWGAEVWGPAELELLEAEGRGHCLRLVHLACRGGTCGVTEGCGEG